MFKRSFSLSTVPGIYCPVDSSSSKVKWQLEVVLCCVSRYSWYLITLSSFDVLVGHLYVFLKTSIQVLCSFKENRTLFYCWMFSHFLNAQHFKPLSGILLIHNFGYIAHQHLFPLSCLFPVWWGNNSHTLLFIEFCITFWCLCKFPNSLFIPRPWNVSSLFIIVSLFLGSHLKVDFVLVLEYGER